MHPTADPSPADATVARLAAESADVRRFILKLRIPDDDAADCVQEALIRLWLAVRRGETIRDPRAWTFRVAHRLAVDVHRRRARLERLPAEPGGMLGADPAHAVVGSHVNDELRWLPSRRRQVLHLRLLSGFTHHEVAATLGISASASRSHATQGLADLRRRLDGTGTAARPAIRHGGRAAGFDPVGVLASPHGLSDPAGIDVDPLGRIWVVEAGRDVIAIFSREGRFLERWGRSGSAPGELSFRRALGNVGDVRFRPDGGFYVSDNGNHRVQWFGPDRQLVTAWGRPGRGPGEFLDPWSVRLDQDGLVYVSDAVRNDVQVFTPEGGYLHTIGRRGSGDGRLDFQGDAVPVGRRLAVADHGNRRIAWFDLDGRFLGTSANGLLAGPDGLDAAADGSLVVADSLGAAVVLLGPDGSERGRWAARSWMIRLLPDGRILTSVGDRVEIRAPTAIPVTGSH